jgi:hypothetical protein
MALVVADRVKETTTTTGTGAITLAGATTNFVTFSSVLSNGDTTYYAIVDDANTDFEVGLGTYASSGNTLTRTTVLASTNSGSAVNLSAGSKEVFITYPADKSVNRDASGNVSVSGGVTATQVDLTGQGDLRLQDSTGGEYVALQAAATVGSSYTLTLPTADGSADQFIKTDGSGNLSFAAAGGGGFQSMQVFTSSGTWTKPAGINTIKVTVTGGGGAGGAPPAGGYLGNGGGAGGTVIEVIDVSGVSTAAVTVGAGGATAAYGGGTGGDGGTSSFASYCSSTGGTGGSTASQSPYYGGAPGTGSNGDINLLGGYGHTGNYNSAGASIAGSGGASYFGGGGNCKVEASGNGNPGQAYGSGGGGGRTNDSTTRQGGNGKAGIVIVEEFA